jgi:hypothetical protein
MVQLVIYPSFKFYSTVELRKWHSRYTRLVSFVVVPLMFGQLITSGWLSYQNPSPLLIIKLVLIFAIWGLTFLIFVPLHHNIDRQENPERFLDSLVNKNWMRTVLWNVILVLSLLHKAIF